MNKKIGIIARCDSTGLGNQSKEFFDHIPCKALVVDISQLNHNSKQNHNWYPNQPVVYYNRQKRFPIEIVKEFLKDINILFCFETPYDYTIFSLCKLMGIKTFLQLNYEFLEYPSSFTKPTMFVSPSVWHYGDIPEPKVFLPVPVNTNHFTETKKEKTFVHVAGNPAHSDRNGTHSFLSALQFVDNEITAIVYSQKKFVVPEVPKNVTLIVDFRDKQNYWENYSGGVMVMPRKYGGLCLPVNESLAAGMPVIMPDISPNNHWLPNEWLVKAEQKDSFMCKKVIDIYECHPLDIAKKIDQFCDNSFYNTAVEKSIEIKKRISWDYLLPKYYQLFRSVL